MPLSIKTLQELTIYLSIYILTARYRHKYQKYYFEHHSEAAFVLITNKATKNIMETITYFWSNRTSEYVSITQ